jgi:hypothetical protein
MPIDPEMQRLLLTFMAEEWAQMSMSRKLLVLGAMASLAMGQASGAAEDTNTPVAPAAVGARGLISCHGASSVPVTSDPEQTIPMKIVAILNCNNEVAVLSGFEGYTVKIRMADGKNGYVEVSHLVTTSQPASAPAAAPTEAAVSSSGVVRWRSGQAGSEQLFSAGNLVESLTAEGLTVQVSLVDTGWKFRAEVAVANAGENAVDVRPSRMTLDELEPALKSLPYQAPGKIASALNHQVLWTAANAAPTPSAVAQHSAFESGNFYPAAYQAPASQNYLALHQEAERMALKSVPLDSVKQIKALALHDASIKPNENISGAVWFERDPNSRELSMIVPAGDLLFEFPFSFPARK